MAELEGKNSLSAEKDETIRLLSQSLDQTIEGWALALEMRDRDSNGHSLKVANLTVRTAAALGISGCALEHIRRGALLHDVGKLGVPESILQKPGSLTESEWLVLQMHPAYSYQILEPIEFLKPAIDIPYYHRERWDGSGYPQGLKGEEIPFAARIFAVVDVWEALTSDRPYRPAWEPRHVAVFLREQAGIKFDAHVVEIFLSEIIADQL
jgi:HD-GYP domain-containing protein (c-di-GMP phosphodiesterase class II)